MPRSAELHEHTEGWCAGLYLAALSAKAERARRTRCRTFRGDDRFVVEYLRSELLSRLPRAELRFLTRTAVLERMSGPLCDAVLDSSGSAAKFESLERSNLFVVPLDRNRRWYRYHRLFRELLRAELERAEPDLVPQLLARAVAWSERTDSPRRRSATPRKSATSTRWRGWSSNALLPAYESGRFATVERWLGWLEAHGALERNAAVAVVGALLAAIWGRPVAAERWADAAERATYDGTLPDGSPSGRLVAGAAPAPQLCREVRARMRGDAELALRTVAAESPFRTSASLLARDLACADRRRRAGRRSARRRCRRGPRGRSDRRRGSGARAARRDRDRARGVGRGRRASPTARSTLIRRSGIEAYPTSAFVYRRRCPRRASPRRDPASPGAPHPSGRLRPRLTYALPYLAVQTRFELARAYLAQRRRARRRDHAP